MALLTMAVLLVLTQVNVLANLYCSSISCVACTFGYNFQNISCLEYCPSGYYISGANCIANSSQDLFTINFFSFKKFGSNSIETFSHPNLYKFNSESKEAPISTFDRGFYFDSNSFIVSNTSWVLGPTFCFSIFYRALSPGIIFKIIDDSKFYLSFSYDISILFHISAFDGINYFTLNYSKPYINQWNSDALILHQVRDYFVISVYGIADYYYYKEFRMDSNSAKGVRVLGC